MTPPSNQNPPATCPQQKCVQSGLGRLFSATEVDLDIVGAETYEGTLTHFEAPPPDPMAVYVGVVEGDSSFSDDRTVTDTLLVEQAGAYDDEGTISASRSLLIQYEEESSNQSEGSALWDVDGIPAETEFSQEEQGERTYTVTYSETYSRDEGNEASWSSSDEFEHAWEYHYSMTMNGHTTCRTRIAAFTGGSKTT